MPARFRATIRKAGVNPYVDVPERVSRALAASARAGRVRVRGRLNRVEIQGTLVPVRAGGGRSHRLYVNGGMRSAAGVGVGDTVSLNLDAVAADAVSVPSDLRAALRRAGARDAFGAFPASRRRELVRFVDDARNPEARRRRIAQTVAHALGRERGSGAGAARAERPLWTCPRCGNAFVTRNQWHSCRRHTLDDAFAGKSLRVRELFERFRALVEACGPVTLVPYRDRVGFMVKVRFAGATPRANALDVGFWLTRRIDSPRFKRVETLDPRNHIYTVRVSEPAQLDRELAGWIRESYAIGCREHLRGR